MLCANMHHLSLGEYSKPQSSQKARLLGGAWGYQEELGPQGTGNKETSEKNTKARQWEPRRARHYMHYGSQEEEEDWRVQNYVARHHHQQPKKTLTFVKLPSFMGIVNQMHI